MGIGSFIKKGFKAVGDFVTDAFDSVLDLFTPDMPDLPKDQGYAVQSDRSTNYAFPVVYGTVKLAGNAAYKEVTNSNDFLHAVIALAVRSPNVQLNELYFEGEADVDAEYIFNYVTGEINPDVRFNKNIVNESGGFSALIEELVVQVQGISTGALATTWSPGYNETLDVSFLSNAQTNGSSLITTDKFNGFSSVYLRYKYDRDIYRGEPRPVFIMQNTAISNPIDAIKDYLTSAEYGMGLDPALIDTASFTQAALDCDAAGYAFNGILSTGDEFQENLKKLLKIADADLWRDGNSYKIKVRGQDDASFTFNHDTIIGDISYTSGGTDNRYNKIVINFTDREGNYKTNSAEYNSDDYLLETGTDLRLDRDGGTTLEKRETLDGCDNFTQAANYAEYLFKRLMFNKAVEFVTSWDAINVNVGDVVGLTSAPLGFADKEFRVADKQINLDSTIKWSLLEHDDSIYTVNHGNVRPSSGTLTYPNPYAKLAAPTNVQVSLVTNDKFGNGRVEFTPIAVSTVNRYIAELTDSKGNVFEYTASTSPIAVDVKDDVYSVEVYAVSDFDVKGQRSAPYVWDVKTTYITALGFGIQSVESGTDQLIKNADGTINSRIKVSMLAIDAAIFRGYVIDYRVSGDADWTTQNSTTPNTYINSVKDGANYEIRASVLVDGGLLVEADTVSHTVIGKTEAPADVASASITIKDRNVILKWDLVADLDVNKYEVRAGGTTWENAERLGEVFGDTFTYAALANFDVWHVKAIDTTGHYSNNARTVLFSIDAPQTPVVTSQVIDNNVLLSWSAQPQTLDIETYELKRGNDVIGLIPSQFTVVFESESGYYDYYLTAIDIAGNRSNSAMVTVFVNQPPDYVLFANGEDEAFNGTITNSLADNGQLLIPVNTSETWGDVLANGYTTLQDEINAGFTRWLTPNPTTAQYVKTFDFGTVIPSCLATPSYTKAINTGGAVFSQTISVSADNVTYTDYVDYASVYVSNVRYVKVALNVTGTGGNDFVAIKDFKIKLDAKIKKDAGIGTAVSGDAGGTAVSFNLPFADIASITVTPSLSSGAAYAVYDFVDAPNPGGFDVYLYDNNGTRKSGSFSWAVTGY